MHIPGQNSSLTVVVAAVEVVVIVVVVVVVVAVSSVEHADVEARTQRKRFYTHPVR